MDAKQKKVLVRIIIVFCLFIGLFIAEHTGGFTAMGLDAPKYRFLLLALHLIPYLIIGYDILWKAIRNISHGQVFDENFLMVIATFGAFFVGEYLEAVAVMLFYQTGELFQSYAVGKSRRAISAMMDICPEYANLEEDGVLTEVDPDDVEIGSVIVVKPGERVPLDGVVLGGSSLLDTTALTGESVPRSIGVGDEIISGCVNGSGTLRVRVTKEFEDSTVAKILELVENASSKKAKTEKFITKFAKYYTPLVTIGAVLLAVIPPLVTGDTFGIWLHKACIFLVVSCPCALVISVPLGFFGGIGAASKLGVLVKGSNYLEAMAEVSTLVFDKTGTLTKGEFKVSGIYPQGCSEAELLELAAYGEVYSNHPIGEALKEAYGKAIEADRVAEAEEIAGHGIRVKVDGAELLLGNEKLLQQAGISYMTCDKTGTVVYVAKNGQFIGSIVIADGIKEGAKEAVGLMRRAGVKRFVMLTGDRKAVAEAVAKDLALTEVHAELLPGDKVDEVEKLLQNRNGKEKVAFVGDGINDAPVLTRADIGIAMGSMGSDAAIEAADIVLMDDDIRKIANVVSISRKTLTMVSRISYLR